MTTYTLDSPTHADYLAIAECDLRIANGELETALAEADRARIEMRCDGGSLESVVHRLEWIERARLAIAKAEKDITHHAQQVRAGK